MVVRLDCGFRGRVDSVDGPSDVQRLVAVWFDVVFVGCRVHFVKGG